MNAVILAAGAGRRLSEVAAGRPKCLINIGGQSILSHQINALESFGIDKYLIVVGYRSRQVVNEAERLLGDRVSFVVNPVYASTNTSYSLLLAIDKLRDGFYYLNGDVLFSEEVLFRLEASSFDNALALDTKECGEEEVKIAMLDNHVMGLSKEVSPEIAAGEFIGIAKFDATFAGDLYKSLDLIVNLHGDRMAYFEKGVEFLLHEYNVGAVNVSDLPSVEIDFPEDLQYARDVVLPQLQMAEEMI
ncbi:MAG: phosphocholine cytidylyltransferase family protein [Calditrichaeota bacterium]|nr:phosphocholine cytidylyltransferase family protein [Calditrichota bacterium]